MPDGKIISCSDDKTVKIWDPKTGAILNTFEGHKDYVYAIDFMKNGHLVTCSRNGEVIIFDPVKDEMVNRFRLIVTSFIAPVLY